MACVEEIHLGDIGTIFRLTIVDCDVPVDISSASTMEITFKPPQGASKVKTPVFNTDGTNGIIDYTTIVDDLDEVGQWKMQARVTLPTGTWRSNIETFKVHSNL